MNYLVDQQMLDSIWGALNQAPSIPDYTRAIRIFDRIMEKEWATNSDVEDLVDTLDARLSYAGFDVMKLSKIVDIHWEYICYRPNKKANGVSEFEAIRPADVCALLIMLERIGFLTNPAFACEKLLPLLKQKGRLFFTRSELEVFWFNKVRHKYAEVILTINDKIIYWEEIASIKTSLGYKVSLNSDEKGVLLNLSISSPKYRRRTEPERTTCDICGVEWRKGDPDSSYQHRKEHKKRLKYLDPLPNQKFIEDRKSNPESELVRAVSPAWKHKEMYLRAVAFRREMHYDFVQWKSPKGDTDPYVHGYLFVNEVGIIVGACSFRYHKSKNEKKYWALDWVWICPKERGKGHLSKRWQKFRKQFGDFFVTPPVSNDMQAFLKGKGELHLMDVPE